MEIMEISILHSFLSCSPYPKCRVALVQSTSSGWVPTVRCKNEKSRLNTDYDTWKVESFRNVHIKICVQSSKPLSEASDCICWQGIEGIWPNVQLEPRACTVRCFMVLSFAISENFCVLPASRSVRHWSIWPSATLEIWVVLVVLVLLSQSVLVLSLYGHSLLQSWSSQKKLGLQAATAAMTGPKRCARNHLNGLGHILVRFQTLWHSDGVRGVVVFLTTSSGQGYNEVEMWFSWWKLVFLQAKVLQHSGIESCCDVAQLQLFNAHAQFRPEGLLFGWQLFQVEVHEFMTVLAGRIWMRSAVTFLSVWLLSKLTHNVWIACLKGIQCWVHCVLCCTLAFESFKWRLSLCLVKRGNLAKHLVKVAHVHYGRAAVAKKFVFF